MENYIKITDQIIAALIPYQAIIFAILLLIFSRKNGKSKRFLGIYMIFNTILYSYLFFYYSGYYETIIYPYYFIIPIVLLIQPFFYFYIRSLTNADFKCSYKLLIHFLPSFVFLIMNLSLYSFLSHSEKLQLMSLKIDDGNKILRFFLQMHLYGYHYILSLQALVYLILIIKSILKYKKELPENFANFEGVKLNWLIFLLVFYFTIATIQESLGYIDNLFYDINARIWYNIFILFTILFIGISGLIQKETFNNEETGKGENKENQPKEKYKSSTLKDELKQELSIKLKKYLEEEKPYLNKDFKLNDLSIKLGTNRQYLSQIINETYNKNFYTLINEYRINEAIEMFSKQKHKNLTINGVANSVGFNSKSTFNSLFKKFTGKTPTQYIKENGF